MMRVPLPYAVGAFAAGVGILALLSFTPTPDAQQYSDAIRIVEGHYAEQQRRATAGEPTSTSPLAHSYYKPVSIAAPVLTGLPMAAFAALLRIPLLGDALANRLKQDNGYWKLRCFAAALRDTTPMFYPHRPAAAAAAASTETSKGDSFIDASAPPAFGARAGLIRQLHTDFTAKTRTPTEHVRDVLKLIEASESGLQPLRAVIDVDEEGALAAAAAATERYAAGRPLSILDGVALVVKTEMAARGLVYSLGMGILQQRVADYDSEPVTKLRQLGAIIVGVTNMHEIGLGTTGFNAFAGSPRNPHNRAYHTGGSSSGSGAAVAAGLVPAALGADGGGSIRIPAALCGVVGLKGTFGRVPAASEIAYTIGHVGPMATTVDDVAILMAAIAASDDEASVSFPQPRFVPSYLADATLRLPPPANEQPLRGLRVGVYRAFNNDALAPQRRVADATEQRLVSLGATIVDVELPFADVIFNAHTVSIISEMSTSMDRYRSRWGEISLPVQVTLKIAERLSNEDYLAAQMVRRWMYDYTTSVLFNRSIGCDVMLTPATARPAPAIPADPRGEINLQDTAALMRFMTFSNLVGVPGIVVPAGATTLAEAQQFNVGEALPLGVQLLAGHWQEPLLLRVARHLESA